ncbi:Xylanase inhibitor, C-terminal [Dillenia turbinata]|uniref:Xylanase inhibitor, C-terminal n=1 Tax=Dillenia turbinata TaxID=194707 RepID=A0AAN8ZMA3_9MAGN
METELLELFESVKKAADAAAAADGASSNGPEVDRCIDALKTLKKFPVSYDALVSAQGEEHDEKNFKGLTRMIFNSAHILWARDSVGFGGMGKNGSYYALNLESISVNGHALPINRSAFATSADRRVVVDSGTALIYLVAGAYDVIINADSDSLWCIAIQRIDEGPSIIGGSSANFNVTLDNNNSRRSHVAKSMMTYILSVFLLLLL